MKVCYLDCFSGISGDMFVGALLDAGGCLDHLQRKLDSLNLEGVSLEVQEVRRAGLRATHFHVRHPEQKAHRHLHHIVDLIRKSGLTAEEQALAESLFQRLAEAEAFVHGTTIEKVHFHEVGAVDSIVDIVSAAVLIRELGIETFHASEVVTGFGTVDIDHGTVPIPAPATSWLLRQVPVQAGALRGEMTTPTGAALIATLVSQFGGLPPMVVDRVGYGAGTRETPGRANLLRASLGELTGAETNPRLLYDEVEVIECNLDDCTGEVVGRLVESIWALGVLDVCLTPIIMKKGRPGQTVSVLTTPQQAPAVAAVILQQSSSLGVRTWRARRTKLERREVVVMTEWGPVKGKTRSLPDGTDQFKPEFDECSRIAEMANRSVQEIQQRAINAYYQGTENHEG